MNGICLVKAISIPSRQVAWKTRMATIVATLGHANGKVARWALRRDEPIRVVAINAIKIERALCLFCAVIACLVLASGCVSSQPITLEAAIDKFYRAEKAHDWKTVWAFAHPVLKQKAGPYHEFAKDADERDDEPVSWRIISIEEITEPNLICELKGLRAVKVPMDVAVYYRDSKETVKAEDQTDYWVQLQNGRWLWYYRGGASD